MIWQWLTFLAILCECERFFSKDNVITLKKLTDRRNDEKLYSKSVISPTKSPAKNISKKIL